jgi:hypothetical protein
MSRVRDLLSARAGLPLADASPERRTAPTKGDPGGAVQTWPSRTVENPPTDDNLANDPSDAKRKRTSTLMLDAAKMLTEASAGQLHAAAARLMQEHAAQLTLRARWIQVARQDGGLSEERRLGVAAIEDVEGGR